MNNQVSDLDFLPEKETAVIEGYAARDEFGALFCYDVIPSRDSNYWAVPISARGFALPYEALPSVTWETGPKRIRIKIEEIKE